MKMARRGSVKGGGTAALAGLRPGDSADLMGPLGNGFPVPGGKTLLIGGGVGLPPLLYAAKTYENTHTIAGCRTNGQVILADEFPSADLCTDDGSAGFHCYPHERMDKLLSQGERPGVIFSCGPYPLLKAVARVAAKHGVPCFVSMEERMACGVGACLVCACSAGGRYLRCCKDGPVFGAPEVDWE
jgi:dihydroorotate dehydrogenase electron transfer subunit